MYRGFGVAFFWVALAGLPSAAVAEDATLLDRCFTPQALAGTASEIKPQHNHVKLDLAALRREPIPAASPVPEAMRGSIRGVELPPGVKLIALTFDLCETDGSVAGYDGRIVDLLRRENVKATFFAGGKWMETHPERMAQLLADSNFEIGSHGLRHLDMARLKGEALKDEIALTEATYSRARKGLTARQCASPTAGDRPVPERMSLLRFPYGTCDAGALAAVADQGLYAIQWDSGHGRPGSASLGQGNRRDHPRQGPPGRHHCCARERPGLAYCRGPVDCHSEAQGRGLWLRHGERTARCGKARDRG